LRPIVVTSATGAPSRKLPAILPLVARYRAVWPRDIHLMMNLLTGESMPFGRGFGMTNSSV
jgi:hypothetical protein